jgi:hypothetical protein
MWSVTGSTNDERAAHIAALLPDGKVLVAGGYVEPPPDGSADQLRTAEVYDPGTGTWTATDDMNVGRSFSAEVVLPDGSVLVTGGVTHIICSEVGCAGSAITVVEIYVLEGY